MGSSDKMKLYKVISFWEFFIFLFFFSLSLFLILFYFKGMGASLTHKGIKSLKKKDFAQAQQHFNQALAKKPFDPWPYMNMALSYDLLNRPDKALKTYHIVSSQLMKKSNLAVFYSYFNKGELNGRLGQLKKALENYQQALKFRYKEKEIKKNIELLFQNNKPSQGNKKKQDKSQSENKPERKNEDQQDRADKNKEKEGNSQPEDKQKQTDGEQQDGLDKNKKHSSHTMENQTPQSDNGESDPNQSQEAKESKGLSEKEQKAILEEIEKQENKARAKFYQRKKIFGDKTKKDW